MKLAHAVLRYLRIENEKGLISPTALLFYVGCFCALWHSPLGLVPLAFGWLAWQLKESREHACVMQAMETNHEVAITKRSDDAEKLAAKMEELEKLVREMATPERQAIVKKMAEALKLGIPMRGMAGLG